MKAARCRAAAASRTGSSHITESAPMHDAKEVAGLSTLLFLVIFVLVILLART
jgi:hypothetical protein